MAAEFYRCSMHFSLYLSIIPNYSVFALYRGAVRLYNPSLMFHPCVEMCGAAVVFGMV